MLLVRAAVAAAPPPCGGAAAGQRRFCNRNADAQQMLWRTHAKRMRTATGKGFRERGTYDWSGKAPVARANEMHGKMEQLTGSLSSKQWEKKAGRTPEYARIGRAYGGDIRIPVPGTLQDSDRFSRTLEERLMHPSRRVRSEAQAEALKQERKDFEAKQNERRSYRIARLERHRDKLHGFDVEAEQAQWRPGDVNWSRRGRASPGGRYSPLRDAVDEQPEARTASATAEEAYRRGGGAVPLTLRKLLVDNVGSEFSDPDWMDKEENEGVMMATRLMGRETAHITTRNHDGAIQGVVARHWNGYMTKQERKRRNGSVPASARPKPYEAGPQILTGRPGKLMPGKPLWEKGDVTDRRTLAERYYKPKRTTRVAHELSEQHRPRPFTPAG